MDRGHNVRVNSYFECRAHYINRINFLPPFRYLSSWWAQVDLISHGYSAGWCIWYIVLVVQDLKRDKGLTNTTDSVNASLSFNLSVEVWQFAGVVCTLLVGVRILKYMKLHASLRIYSKVLSKTWK